MELLGHYDTVTWILVLGSFFSFGVGWATGSNDVANAFGTSVGAKTLTLMQATCIAAVFEFAGAMILGRVNTSVIAGSITNISYFQRQPEIYAYGMMWALFTTFVWNTFGSYMELNVSTTHSIIGSIMGFSMVYGGSNAVNWAVRDNSSFPPYKGFVPIVCSWFIAPILCGLAAAILFMGTKYLVLKRKNSYQMSFYLLPVFVALTVWLCVFFTLTKGAAKYLEQSGNEMSETKACWVSAVTGAGCALVTLVVVLPILKKKADLHMDKKAADEEAAAKGEFVDTEKDVTYRAWEDCNWYQKIWFICSYGTRVDIHDAVEEDPVVSHIHANAEVFDAKTEYAFSYLQVFSAICVAFAHGANDSAYASGPLAGIYYVYKHGFISSKVSPPWWVVFISAISIVIGLATYGYNVTRAMGIKMSKLSPSRGFAAELSVATVILIASQYGLPTSTSQAITGAIIGVGLCEGIRGVNWLFIAKQFASWAVTVVITALFTGALFAQGIYAPSREAGRQVEIYEDWIINMTRTQIKDFNRSLYALPPFKDFDTYAYSLALMDNGTKNYLKPKAIGTLQPKYILPYANSMLSMMKNFTVYSIAVNTDELDKVCLKEAGVKCAHPKLLDSKYSVSQPMTKKIPGTEKVFKLK